MYSNDNRCLFDIEDNKKHFSARGIKKAGRVSISAEGIIVDRNLG